MERCNLWDNYCNASNHDSRRLSGRTNGPMARTGFKVFQVFWDDSDINQYSTPTSTTPSQWPIVRRWPFFNPSSKGPFCYCFCFCHYVYYSTICYEIPSQTNFLDWFDDHAITTVVLRNMLNEILYQYFTYCCSDLRDVRFDAEFTDEAALAIIDQLALRRDYIAPSPPTICAKL